LGTGRSVCNCPQLGQENANLRNHVNFVQKEWETLKKENRGLIAAVADLKMRLGLKELEAVHLGNERCAAKKAISDIEEESDRIRKDLQNARGQISALYDLMSNLRKQRQEAIDELERVRYISSQQLLMKK
jgi:chromosome segregation ATPase